MTIYKNNELALTAKLIPYHKEFRKIAGSVTATILWQQLEYWFSKKKGEPFYKFLEPLKIEKNGYKIGDSWTEELGFSAFEFRAAFSRIGISYKSKKEYNENNDKFQNMMYCSYYDKINRQTWYFRNQKLVETNLGRLRNSISGDEETQSREMKKLNPDIYTENTTENTTENPQSGDCKFIEGSSSLQEIANKKEEEEKLSSQEINDFIYLFEGINPTISYGNKTSRSSVEVLFKKLGKNKAIEIAKYAVSIFGNKFAPVISTPYQLKEKISSLASYKMSNTGKGITRV